MLSNVKRLFPFIIIINNIIIIIIFLNIFSLSLSPPQPFPHAADLRTFLHCITDERRRGIVRFAGASFFPSKLFRFYFSFSDHLCFLNCLQRYMLTEINILNNYKLRWNL